MRENGRRLLFLLAVLQQEHKSAGSPHFNSYAGPFRMEIKEYTQCSEMVDSGHNEINITGMWRHLRAVNSMMFDGVLRIEKTISSGKYGVAIDAAKWDRVAGWRSNFYNAEAGELCAAVKINGRPSLIAISRNNPQIPLSCPFPAGTYHLRNISSDSFARWENFPILIYGRYRVDLQIYDMKSKLKVGCFRAVADVVPKAKSSEHKRPPRVPPKT